MTIMPGAISDKSGEPAKLQDESLTNLQSQVHNDNKASSIFEEYSDVTGRVALSIFLLNHIQINNNSSLAKELLGISNEYKAALRGHAHGILKEYTKGDIDEEIKVQESSLWQRAVTSNLGNILNSYNETQRSNFEDFKSELRRITSPWMQLLIGVMSGIIFGVLVYQLQQLPNPFEQKTNQPSTTSEQKP